MVERNATAKNIDAINAINADRGRTKFDLVPASTSSGMFANGGRLTADTTKMASAAQSGISRDVLNELKAIRKAIEDTPNVAVPVDSISAIQRDTQRRKRGASFS
jgi:vacuolar-type H+-ATPase subunit C/Vma6